VAGRLLANRRIAGVRAPQWHPRPLVGPAKGTGGALGGQDFHRNDAGLQRRSLSKRQRALAHLPLTPVTHQAGLRRNGEVEVAQVVAGRAPRPPGARLRRLPSRLRCDPPLGACFGEAFFLPPASLAGLRCCCVLPVDAKQATHAFCSSASHCTKPHRAASQSAPRPSQAGGVAGACTRNHHRPTRPVPAAGALGVAGGHPRQRCGVSTCLLTWKVVVSAAAATRGWWVDAENTWRCWARRATRRADRAAQPGAEPAGRFQSKSRVTCGISAAARAGGGAPAGAGSSRHRKATSCSGARGWPGWPRTGTGQDSRRSGFWVRRPSSATLKAPIGRPSGLSE